MPDSTDGPDYRKFDKYENRKKIIIRHTVLVSVGYLLCCITIVAGKFLGLTSIRWWQILFCFFISMGTMALYYMLVQFTKPEKISSSYANTIYLTQFLIWLFLYIFFVLWINELRLLTLFFAMSALIFLVSNSSMAQSLAISCCAVLITIVGAYFAIYHLGQAGNFKLELYFALFFTPVAAYLSYIAGTIKKQKKELNIARNDAIKVRDALWGEMALAKKIQTALLPEDPAMEGYEISAYMEPADEVGGDYYDVIQAAGRNWLVIGDVSGHGVPSGLVMMMAQTSIHSVLYQNPDIPPADLLTAVNRVITENIQNLGEDKYMTINVLALVEDGNLIFSGLHQDIFVYRAKAKELTIYETKGMWLGLVEDIENMLAVEKISLDVDDILLLYTDGVTEARKYDETDGKKIMYGNEQLKKNFIRLGDKRVSEIRDGLIESLKGYARQDDVTFLIVKRVR